MKRINAYLISIAVTVCGFVACDDEFMDRIPKTSVTAPGFFKSVSDLQLYVNGIYETMPPDNGCSEHFQDFASDNVTYRLAQQEYASLLYGRISEENIGGWDGWDKLRRINLMLTSLDNVATPTPDDVTQANSLIGVARYFRAAFYIPRVQTYSDVPWYDRVLESTDEDLYKAQDPRDVVVDHIMEDLEFAVANIKPDLGNRTIISKYAALAALSRFALYEGTYRKYHPEIGLASSANRFLERAVSASEEIMNSGVFEITGAGAPVVVAPGILGSEGFRALFSSKELNDNREIILWFDNDKQNGRFFRADDLTKSTATKYSMSRSLQESFLTKDGRPFSTVAGYATKTFSEVFIDRDPRLSETFVYPGLAEEQTDGSLIPLVTKPARGGYDQSKFFYRYYDSEAKTADGIGQYTGLPLYRYGEVLLNYAEAKAELGQLDAAAINRSIKLLRDRVGMPAFNPSVEVDQALRDLYPGVTDVNILAVRRERRVELAGEGLRKHDLFRWYAGKLFEAAVSQQGIFVPGLPYVYDVTGDGVPDMGIAASESSKTDDEVTWYYLDDPDGLFYLENGTHGYIRNKEDNLRQFVEPKYYYLPIPRTHLVVNPNLHQPYGW
jgi:hypothetical protein